MKRIIITIIFTLSVSATTTPAFAREEWFEVAEASGITYDIAISREVRVAGTPHQMNSLDKLTSSLIKNRESFASYPLSKNTDSPPGPADAATGGGGGSWHVPPGEPKL
jgi:hypothetical protein